MKANAPIADPALRDLSEDSFNYPHRPIGEGGER